MKKVIGYTFLSLFIIFLLVLISFVVYFSVTTKDIELDIDRLEKVKTSLLLDNDNNPIKEENYIKYDDIPKNLINAFVAIEDKRFFKHNGIDVKRMLSASIYNIVHRKKAQGASTITQQLIKNTHLTSKKTFDRKLKEIKLALKLEKVMSKEEILEKYLNSLYFGNGIYGIKDASLYIFAKHLDELNISECATIAGIIKAPLYYSPLNNISKSTERRNIVLAQMYNSGYISDTDYNNAKNSDITINKSLFHSNYADIYQKQVYNEVSSLLNIPYDEVVNGNYTIGTYYDKIKQKMLYDIMNNSKDIIANNDNMSIISDNKCNGINALYSNKNIDIFSFKRQIGSIMKPIAVYLPCLEYGLMSPATIVNDTKIDINGYCPSNYNDNYRGKISARTALMHSSNVVAVELLNKLGINKSKDFLSKMDIDIQDDGLSIALGGLKDGLTPIEVISAYQAIANNGYYAKNTLIRYIKDKNNEILYRHKRENKKIVAESASYLMTDMLINTVQNGTARKLSSLPFQIASKTGTVAHPTDKNINIDAYNLSFTTQNTLFVWFGGCMAQNVQGGAHPTIIAREICESLYSKNHPNSFNIPSSISKLYFDRENYVNNGDILLCEQDNKAIYDYFDNRYLPTQRLVADKNIKYNYKNNILSIENIEGTNVKIFKTDIFGKKLLVTELINAKNMENIFLPRQLFSRYAIEIIYHDKLIKSIVVR